MAGERIGSPRPPFRIFRLLDGHTSRFVERFESVKRKMNQCLIGVLRFSFIGFRT